MSRREIVAQHDKLIHYICSDHLGKFSFILLSALSQISLIAITRLKTRDLVFLKVLAEAGKIKAVIDRRYLLEQMAEVHRFVEKGQRTGNTVITLEDTNKNC